MHINPPRYTRRTLLTLAGGVLLGAEQASSTAQVRIDPESVVATIPDDFLGFGYEISSVAVKGLLSPRNTKLVQLYRTLGSHGVVRIGGNTSDYSQWEPDGKAVSAPKATVTNREVIRDLGGFLRATGWRLIWGLNLGSGMVESAVDQALAVADAAGDSLLCFEIGNEPDLFSHEGHRPPGYSYAAYQHDFARVATEIRKHIPDVALAGPDVAGATDWVASFAQDEADSNLKLLTHHYYRAGQKQPAATLDNLLHPDPHFLQVLRELQQDSERFDLPYRLVELNSFSGGGKPGVSDTFASALWALDLLFLVAAHGGAGVNLETGVNQLGFVSSYSPIFEEDGGMLSARPSYYAMLAFAQAAEGEVISTTVTAGPTVNLTAYGVKSSSGRLSVTIINKDLHNSCRVDLHCPIDVGSGAMMRLTSSAFDNKADCRLSGAAVSADGRWKPEKVEEVAVRAGQVTLELASASAAVLQLRS